VVIAAMIAANGNLVTQVLDIEKESDQIDPPRHRAWVTRSPR